MIDHGNDIRLSVTDIPDIIPLDRAEAKTGSAELGADLQAVLFGGDFNTFVVLDAAKIPQLSALLDAESIENLCLFTGDAAQDYADVAPWIAELKGDERLLRLLFSKTPEVSALWPKSAAIFVRSDAALSDVWSHFRRLTKVPRENGTDLYFRFWDPEVTYHYYDGIADWPERVSSLCVSGHAIIQSIIAPVSEQECARVFRLENSSEPVLNRRPLRLEKRDLQLLSEMQWPRLERDLTSWLLRTDPVRFRGFNKDRRTTLAAHAIREGKAFGLTFKEEYAHFLYMMTFLGGWFHRAPQFIEFTNLLTVDSETRYLNLKRDFPKVYAKRFGHMGKPSEVMQHLVQRADACLARVGGWDGIRHNDLADISKEIEERLGWKDIEADIVRADAQGQATEIGLQTQLGRELHYLLWLLVGPHYLTDPLFPWAGEVFAAGDNADDALKDVAVYAHRRLTRTLSLKRIMTRAKI